MILADTSIWIDYLRGQNNLLAQYIQQDQLVIHSMILGELALGSFKDRQKLLRSCASLPLMPTVSHEVVMDFIDEFSLMGKIVPKLTKRKTMLTLEMAIQKIQQLSPEQRNKVIEYIEFLEFQARREQQTETSLEPIQETENLALPNDEDFAEMMEISDRGIEKYRNVLIELAK